MAASRRTRRMMDPSESVTTLRPIETMRRRKKLSELRPAFSTATTRRKAVEPAPKPCLFRYLSNPSTAVSSTVPPAANQMEVQEGREEREEERRRTGSRQSRRPSRPRDRAACPRCTTGSAAALIGASSTATPIPR